MLNPLNFLSKFIKSNNQKELDRISKIVTKINLLEDSFKNLDDLAKISVNKLAEIDKIGLTIASNIKAELKKVRY